MAQDAPQPTAPLQDRDDALAVVRRLREAGHLAYFAGGCVRDQLLGLTPKDYDVATDAPPTRVRELFTKTDAVGAAFGVILVRRRRSMIEVATFRTDGSYADGRRPTEVTFATAEEDAKRRDFTINGLFFDPLDGRVIDYVGGQNDLKNKVLRAIGDPGQRFAEDHLRLLRAVRFAARFGFAIDPLTADAIGRHADRLKQISPERIADELRRMLSPPTRAAAWEMLWRFSLLQVVFRHLPEKPAGPEATLSDTGPLFPRLAPGVVVPFPLALAALALCYRSAGAPLNRSMLLERPEARRSVQACRTALRISNEEAEVMEGVLHLSPLLLVDPPSVATMKRFLAAPTSHWARVLLDALLQADARQARIAWLRDQFARLEAGDVAPKPLITGDDLKSAGLSPGPAFKRVLDEVYDAQLEGRVVTKEQALEMGLGLVR